MLNLDELGKYRENNRIEAKKALGGLPQSLWETYSAFANTLGGYILLGVEELADKSFRTVALPDPEKLVQEFWNTINNRQKLSVNILTDKHVRISQSGDHRIIVIEVPRANRKDKPVYVGADPFAGSYRRNGEGDYHCTKDEVRNMMRDQADVSQDLRVLNRLGPDAFDYETIRRYRIRWQNTRPEHAWEGLTDEEFLHKLGAVGRAEDGTLHPTVAGILMFGYEYEIVKEFPNYFLDYQEHDNDSTRWTDRIVSNLGDWSGNLFDFYVRVASRLTQEVKTPFKLDGITRVDDTPVHKALREALANALIHANYYDRRGLVIHRYPQKIVIANPGGLRISVDDAIFGGISDPRNTTLLKLFGMINVAERAGTGVSGIYDAWRKEGWKAPVLMEEFDPDRTVIILDASFIADEPAINTGDKLEIGDKSAITVGDNLEIGDNSECVKRKIIDYVTTNVVCKAADISQLLDLKPSRTREYLSMLVSDGILTVDGGNRNRTYRLKA